MHTLTLRVVAVLLALTLGTLALSYIAASAAAPFAAASTKADKDCDDFKTQKKAQRFFKEHNPRSDPHNLDADNDRIACEDNRCPCTRRWHQQHGREFAVRRNG